MTTSAADPATVPGAMAVQLSRTLPSGAVVEFESAPAGWVSKNGQPRVKDWRCYWLTPAPGEKRARIPSVTTIIAAILPKDGLPPWYEARGIEGAREALRRQLVHTGCTPEEWIQAVRANRLGADRARDDAADRGLNLHAILEEYARTSHAPNPSDHPEPHRPFIQGLARWLLWADPEPVGIELLVADPERGYAGRIDLIARINGRLTLVDLKTQPNGAIYDSAHLQVKLYRQAEQRYGEHREIEDELLVAVDERGGFREMESVASETLATRALEFYPAIRSLCLACEQANKIWRETAGTST